jgi:transposase-like protein
MGDPVPEVQAAVAPSGCPFCESTDIHTTSKTISVSTYWRCTACGQIWNAERLQPPRRRNDLRW